MICEHTVRKFCKDDITKIENYEKAMADASQVWHCHHRLELTLDGEFAHSEADLKRMNIYFNRPYFELIFLTAAEHKHLHNLVYKHSDAIRKKISERTSAATKGKARSEAQLAVLKRAKRSKGMHWYNDGIRNYVGFTCPDGFKEGRLV